MRGLRGIRRCRAAAAAVVLSAGLVGCSGSGDATEAGDAGTVEVSCQLEGSGPGTATVVATEDDLTVTWEGHEVPASDQFDFGVQVADDEGVAQAQLNLVFRDGEQVGQLVTVFEDYAQVQLDLEAEVDGDRVTAVFPRDEGPLAGLEIGRWGAFASSRDLQVGGTCPEGDGFLPFE